MKVYTFETIKGFFEFYDLRKAKSAARAMATEIAAEVLVTCMHIPSYKQDWYVALPNGQFILERKGFRADN